MTDIQDYLNEMKRDDAGNADWSITLPQLVTRLSRTNYSDSTDKAELIKAVNNTADYETYMDLSTVRIAHK